MCPSSLFLQGKFGNPEIQKIMKLGVQVEKFTRNATLFFVGAIMQFLGVEITP